VLYYKHLHPEESQGVLDKGIRLRNGTDRLAR
jgi:hypothetical protein